MSDAVSDPAASWTALLDRMRTLGEVIEREADGETERAEGYRHLTRLWSISAEWLLEKADPRRPAFTRVITPWRKFIGDNPDTLYDVAPVESGATYRLGGRRHDAVYVGVTVYGRDEAGGITLLGQVEVDDTADGEFVVAIGGDDPGDGSPWVPLPGGVESLWVRQYFHDPTGSQPASLHLERTDVRLGPPPPLDGAHVAAGLDRMAEFMTVTLDAVTSLSELMGRQPNRPLMAGVTFEVEGGDAGIETVDEPSSSELEGLLLKLGKVSHPTPDNRYAGIWFELEPDEAMVVTGTPPLGARYWGVQLANRWQESLDFVHHGVCLNDRQLQLEPDGTYRIVVAGSDPGVPNWLDTAGHRCGMVNVRALLAEDLDDPVYSVVPIGEAGGTTGP